MTIDREKYKVLYEYQRNQYEEEKARFSKLEDKATKFLTALSFFIPVFILTSTKIIEKLELFNCFVYSLLNFLSVLVFVSACSSWWAILRSMRLLQSERMPSSSIRNDLFDKNSLDTCYLELSELYSSMVQLYRRLNADKAEILALIYNEILFCASSFFLLIIFTFFAMVV